MRGFRVAIAMVLAAPASACGGLGPSCTEWGLTPGTPEFARCQAAKAEREAAGTRGAVEALRAIDAMGIRTR